MMRKSLPYIMGIALALTLIAVAAPKARANDVDQSTFLTFHQPVRIPGSKVLPAGTYLFKTVLLLNDEDGNGVRISNPDGTRIYATLATTPVSRSDTTVNSQLTFAEGSKRQPAVLLAWFYPDCVQGHAFRYSDQETNRIAEERQVTVVAAPDSGLVSRPLIHAGF